MGHYVTGSLWNKHSGTSARYKSSKWKKLKSQERFWKWFMIGGALRSAFIVTGTSPFTSLRWQTRSTSLPISWAALRVRVVRRRAPPPPRERAGWWGAYGHFSSTPPLWGFALHSPRVRELQISSDILSMWKDTSCGVVCFFFFLLQLYHNHAPKCTYKHFITWIWNNAWKINLRIVPKQKVFLPK